MPLGILGKKLGQTRVYDASGVIHSVTVVHVGPNRVIQTKTVENDGYKAVQLGFDDQKEARLTKALFGHIAKQIGEDANRPLPDGEPIPLLEDMIRGTFRFTRSAKHMQRLMIEELDSATSPDVREKMREWNRHPVNNYARILEIDEGDALRDFDPIFMYLAVVGICDFFEAGAPLLELLVPPGTDKERLAKRYEDFVVRLATVGVRKR